MNESRVLKAGATLAVALATVIHRDSFDGLTEQRAQRIRETALNKPCPRLVPFLKNLVRDHIVGPIVVP